jgi:rhodanese-related sulfurtransferase/predicted metal-dependent enzyme (double-stranded beta helix superfamily)
MPWPTDNETLDAGQLAQITARLAAIPGRWRDLVRHDPDRRWFEQVILTSAIEVWLIGWTPGQFTPPHDHGGANGSFTVVEGALVEDVYDGPSLARPRRVGHHAGAVVELDVGRVHRVANEGGENATSIHAYSPPGLPMRRYALTVTDLLERARERIQRLEPQEARRRMDSGALLVDIRPLPLRQREGDIPGAIALDRHVLEWRLDPASPWRIPQIRDHSQEVIVICSEGYASSLAAATLQDLGLRAATDVVGGYQAWTQAGLPATIVSLQQQGGVRVPEIVESDLKA